MKLFKIFTFILFYFLIVRKYFLPMPERIVVLTPNFGDHCSRVPIVLPKWLCNMVGKTCN